jgi:uncharacterized protein YndB with AHSA1/START domain
MADPTVRTVDAGPRAVSREVDVTAPPSAVFALLADPGRLGEIDGSGTVKDTVSGPAPLYDGATFSVKMKQFGLPYRITSTVVAFEQDRMIAWRHPAGHVWRWELAETAPGVTTVTETFDYATAAPAKVFELLGLPDRNAEGITSTLEGLQRRFTA